VDKIPNKNMQCGNFRRTLISLILYEDDDSYAKIANKRLVVLDFEDTGADVFYQQP